MAPRPYIDGVSTARLDESGEIHATGQWLDQPRRVFVKESLIALIEIEGAAAAMEVHVAAFTEDGSPLAPAQTLLVPLDNRAVYIVPLTADYADKRTTTRVTVALAADPASAISHDVPTFPGHWFMFPGETDKPATAAQIAALETQLVHPLCDDHRAFLGGLNGIDYVWWSHPDWDADRIMDDYDLYDHLEEATEAGPDLGLLSDTAYIFGLNDHPLLGYPKDLGTLGFFNSAFLAHMVPVGEDGGGNLFAQALAGTRKGQVFFLDHEIYYGIADFTGPDSVSDLEDYDWPDRPYQEMTSDAFWDFVTEFGYAISCAADLDHMVRALDAYHSGLINKLAPNWRKT